MTAPYVHGGTDAREVARLEKQARFVSAFTFPFFDASPGHRVLDLACGVGAMAGQLALRFPGIELVGVDLSAAQLRACRRNHPTLPVARADGSRLPFPEASFERVHCSWLLEHVSRPLAILEEVRRVLRPGGSAHFVEVDNESLVTRPALPAVHALLARLNAAQVAAGGDPTVGRRLGGLLRAAGFSEVHAEAVELVATREDPAFLKGFVEEWVEIFESLDEALGPGSKADIARACEALRASMEVADVELRYSPIVARAMR